MLNLEGSRVLVDFADSMIGREIVKKLQVKGATVLPVTHKDYDLLSEIATEEMFNKLAPIDYVIHGAAVNGSIAFNMSNPADIFGETMQIGLNVLGWAAANKVKKVVNLLTSCAYSPTDTALQENDFLSGSPDISVAPHGLAKKGVFAYGKYMHQQYGLNAVGVIFNNCYGYAPFNRPEKLKVADALIKRFCDTIFKGGKEVVIWGTGEVKRELLFCEDAAEATVQVLQKYEDCFEPINIGCGEDCSIKDLAYMIQELTGFNGMLKFDTSKPDGQKRKLLDNTKMRERLKWEPPTTLKEGLEKTIKYYRNNYIQYI